METTSYGNRSRRLQNCPAINVFTVKGLNVKSWNALFEVNENTPSVYTSKTASSSPASVKTDCAVQRKSVKWFGQYKDTC